VRTVSRCGALLLACAIAAAAGQRGAADARQGTQPIEDAILAVHAEMTRAGEAGDVDRLFGYMLDTDKGSVVQNGVVLATRQDALDRTKAGFRAISSVRYRWTRHLVSVLSPDVAVLTAEGESSATTTGGETFSRPFAQTVVFVRRDGVWKAIHAHQSSPLR